MCPNPCLLSSIFLLFKPLWQHSHFLTLIGIPLFKTMSHRDMLCLCSILIIWSWFHIVFFFQDWRNCQVSRRCWCVVSTVNFCAWRTAECNVRGGGGQGGTTIHGPVSRDCVFTGRYWKETAARTIYIWLDRAELHVVEVFARQLLFWSKWQYGDCG